MTGACSHDTRGTTPGSTTLRAAIIYEDFPTGLRGRGFAEALAGRIGGGCPLEVSLWRTDLLGDAEFAARAADAAARADYVLLVLKGTRVPGSTTRAWLRRHLPRFSESGASVILLSATGTGSRRCMEAARLFLRHTCARNDVPFFSLVTHAAPPAHEPAAVNADEEPASLLCL